MDRIREELEAVRVRFESEQCPANWNQNSTLLFRKVHQGPAVSLEADLQITDIKINGDSFADLFLSDNHEDNEAVVTLSWEGALENCTCFSTCTIRTQQNNEDAFSIILNKLCREDFTTLRHFTRMLFREYRSRLTTLRRNPLSLDIVHMDLTEFEYLQDNINVLEMNFKNLFSEDIHGDFTFDLRLHFAGASGGEGDACSLTNPETGDVPGLESFKQQRLHKMPDFVEMKDAIPGDAFNGVLEPRGNSTIAALERIQTQLQSQRQSIEFTYREKRRQNQELESSIRRLLNLHKTSGDHLQQAAKSPDRPPKITRHAGDGEESQLPTSGIPIKQETNETFQETDAVDSREVPISDRKPNQRRGQEKQSAAAEANSSDDQKETANSKSGSKDKLQESDLKLERSRNNVSESRTSTVQNQRTKEQNTTPVHTARVTNRTEKKESALPRAHGLDTFLCLDISSMGSFYDSGLPEIKQLALKFVEGIEDIASKHEIEENIGIVAFGESTWIKHEPTNDYSAVRENIERLQVGGMSSLSEILRVGLEFMKEKGKNTQLIDGYYSSPRLIVFTNHRLLHHNYREAMQEQERIISILQKRRGETEGHETVIWVPASVADGGFLRTVAQLTDGSYIVPRDINRLTARQSIEKAACQILVFLATERRSLSGNLENDVTFLLEMYASHLDADDKSRVEGIVRRSVDKGRNVTVESMQMHTERPGLPPLGSRVVRGEDWIWENQDSGGPGTVTGHLERNMVVVEWDCGYVASYRHGVSGAYDLRVVNDQPRTADSDYVISVGCEVTRGPDWGDTRGNEDGGPGGVGVVIMSTGDGTLKVRWRSNGYISTYKCGQDDKLEVLLRDPSDNSQDVTHSKNESSNKSSGTKNARQTYKCKSKDDVEHTKKNNEAATGTSSRKGYEGSNTERQLMKDMTSGSLQLSDPTTSPQPLPQSKDMTKRAVDDRWIWQWLENKTEWRTYCDESIQKLERCFNRRPDGSCLVQREKQSFRVLFKEMEEKCLEDNSRRRVQRIRITKEMV